jgi:endonuclease YncB( thermonuclease family)
MALALAALLVAISGAPASAARGPCIPAKKRGAKCHVATGKVGPVDDGDTITVNVFGDGKRRKQKIRLTGIQTMELTRYGRKRGRRGECHSVRAAERLEQIIRRGRSRVRILARDRSSIAPGRRIRLRRAITVRHGRYTIDPAKVLIREGLALWLPHGVEWPWNRSYSRLAQQARARGIGIWNPRACGRSPTSEIVPLRMKVKWDARGVDGRNINGEWARITNVGSRTLKMGGWWFRDSHLRRYRFGRRTKLAPGQSLKVHPGRGRTNRRHHYWGLGETIFENATGGRRQMGDGGYLFDRRGNMRAAVQYPCRAACTDPAAGRVTLAAHARGREWITVRNVSGTSLSLWEYELESRPLFYEFGRGAVLAPGRAITVWVGRRAGLKSSLNTAWRSRRGLLADRRDVVTLRNRLGAPIACHAWGGKRCPRA